MRKATPAPFRGRMSYLLGRLYLHALTIEGEALATLGLGVKQHAALLVLADEGPMPQQLLGRRLRTDRTTIVAIVDGLERSGFVARRRNPEDRRAYLLDLTRAGRDAGRAGRRVISRVEAGLLAGLTPAERAALTQLLGRAVDVLDLGDDDR